LVAQAFASVEQNMPVCLDAVTLVAQAQRERNTTQSLLKTLEGI